MIRLLFVWPDFLSFARRLTGGVWLLAALFLAAALPARAQSGTTAVITGRATIEKEDALTLTLYFALQDEDGRPLPEAAPADAAILLDDGAIYPAQLEKQPWFLVLALDSSGSMAGLFEAARQEALEIVTAAPPGTQFAIIRFDDQINLEQPFTADKEQAAAALRRMELAENGACIEDVGYTAVQTLAQTALAAPGRAVFIFSDGAPPARAQEEAVCGLYTYKQTAAYAAAQNAPIYLLGGSDIAETMPGQLAADTGGQALTLGSEALPLWRQELADKLDSQWRARADVRPSQIAQRGALLLTLDTGEPLLPAPFIFVADRVYASPEEEVASETLRLEISNLRYDEERNLYEMDVAASPSADLQTLEVEIVDEANRQVGLTVVTNPQPAQRITIAAADWPPGSYTARARARDGRLGLLVREANGAVVQDRYPFEHRPEQPVLLQIEAVRVEDEPARLNLRVLRLEDEPPELVARLRLENEEPVAAFVGALIRQKDNQQAAQFRFDVTREGDTAVARIPAALETGQYVLALAALDEAGNRLAADNTVFVYTPPESAAMRVFLAARDNWLLPFFWLATAVFIGLAAWYAGQRRGRQQAAAAQMAPPVLNAPPEGEAAEPAGEMRPVVLTPVESPDEKITANGALPLTSFPFTIGRMAADLTIAGDFHISRTHARITRDGQAYFLEDLDSANGTFLNDSRLAAREPAALNPERGERITIGKTTTFIFGFDVTTQT